MLYAAIHLRLDACFSDVIADLVHNTLDIFFTDALAHRNLFHQIIIHLRLQIFQRKIIQLRLDLADTKPLGYWAIDLQRFFRNALPALRTFVFQSSHIVQSVRKLNQDHPNILGHGKKHFTQIFRLHFQLLIHLIRPAGKRQTFQLCDPVHQKRHIIAKLLLQILIRHDGIFHHIMKQSRYDRLFIQLQVRQDDRHIQGMNDVRLPRLAELILMRLRRHPVSLFNH